MERGKRIELSALAWKAKVLPLYEPRIFFTAASALLTDTLEAVVDTVLQLCHPQQSPVGLRPQPHVPFFICSTDGDIMLSFFLKILL
jgi:hypothetical protein